MHQSTKSSFSNKSTILSIFINFVQILRTFFVHNKKKVKMNISELYLLFFPKKVLFFYSLFFFWRKDSMQESKQNTLPSQPKINFIRKKTNFRSSDEVDVPKNNEEGISGTWWFFYMKDMKDITKFIVLGFIEIEKTLKDVNLEEIHANAAIHILQTHFTHPKIKCCCEE